MKNFRQVLCSALALPLMASVYVACSSSDVASVVPTVAFDSSVVIPKLDSSVAPTCAAPKTSCGSNCTDTSTDGNNCGSCGKACAAGEVCSGGACGLFCAGGTSKCGTSCVNNQTDSNNCGTCGTKCADGQVCNAGTCALTCAAGTTKCGSSCATTATDNNNCGSCGNVCGFGTVCSAGACVLQCQAPLTKCGATAPVPPPADAGADAGGTAGATGFCTLLDNDNNNCGACGTVCGPNTRCGGGLCCAYNELGCGGTCTNIQNNDANCGACGRACGGDTPFCANSVCISCPAGAEVVDGVCRQIATIRGADISGGSCGGPGQARYNQGDGTTIRVNSKTALITPKSATLRMNGNVQCNTNTPFIIEVRLGTQVIATLNSTVDDCSCSAMSNNQIAVPMTDAQAAIYSAGTPIDFVLVGPNAPLYGFTSYDMSAAVDDYGSVTFVY